MQDEAAKDEETRRNEKLAWDFIREEQRKHAAGSSLVHRTPGARPASSRDGSPQPACPSPPTVDTFQEAANLLRAGLKVVNLRAAATRTSGNSRFRVPLPGPPGVSGWAVTRTGNTRLGQTDPTRRWAGMKKGLTTLDYRVHKGVRVPTAEERADLKLGQIQKPLAARMQARRAEHKLREMLLGKGGGDGESQSSPQHAGKSHWGKSLRNKATLLAKQASLGEEQPESMDKCMHVEGTDGVMQQGQNHSHADSSDSKAFRQGQESSKQGHDCKASETSSDSSSSEMASGMSLLQVSSMGIGHMGLVDIVEAGFEAQELREAERRQVPIQLHPNLLLHACQVW